MKLCPKALSIKAKYERGISETVQATYNDKRAKARALAAHMSYCRMCSK